MQSKIDWARRSVSLDIVFSVLPYRSTVSILMLATIGRHALRYSASLNTSLILSHPISSFIPSIFFILCRPLALLPSSMSNRQLFSNPVPLSACPKKSSCVLLTTVVSSRACFLIKFRILQTLAETMLIHREKRLLPKFHLI